MKYWSTQIKAIDPITGMLKIYGGQKVPGISFEDAENYCQLNGLGYCEVIGESVAEIPLKSSEIDYDIIQMN